MGHSSLQANCTARKVPDTRGISLPIYPKKGKREGKQEMAIKMIKSLMKNQKITFEAAADILGVSKSKQKQLRTLI